MTASSRSSLVGSGAEEQGSGGPEIVKPDMSRSGRSNAGDFQAVLQVCPNTLCSLLPAPCSLLPAPCPPGLPLGGADRLRDGRQHGTGQCLSPHPPCTLPQVGDLSRLSGRVAEALGSGPESGLGPEAASFQRNYIR